MSAAGKLLRDMHSYFLVYRTGLISVMLLVFIITRGDVRSAARRAARRLFGPGSHPAPVCLMLLCSNNAIIVEWTTSWRLGRGALRVTGAPCAARPAARRG